MVTIHDIAVRCNVSDSTVSYVLSGKGDARRIAELTQNRIIQAAKELGYSRHLSSTPNVSKNGTEPTISVYYPKRDFTSSIVSLLEGANQAIDSEIIPVRLNISTYEVGGIQRKRELWSPSGPDAAVIVSPTAKDLQLLAENKTIVPTVLFFRELDGYSSVNTDHKAAAQLAAKHAIESGDGDVSLVLNPSSEYAISLRGKYITDECVSAGIDMQNRVFYCGNSIDAGYELGWELARNNKLNKVIICVYDMVALGIMSALNEAKIEIGEEVKILATSTSPEYLFARAFPPMTVVDLHSREASMKAMTLALNLATKQLTSNQQLVVHPSIIYRKSCPLVPNILNH